MRKVKPFRLATAPTLVNHAQRGQCGRFWYHTAKAQVLAGAVVLDIEPQRFADLLALFSPKVAVIRSIRMAVYYTRYKGQHLRDVTRSTRAAVAHYEETGEIRGPKTSAFAAAIMGDEDRIVLDTWMAQVMGVAQERFSTMTVRHEAERRVCQAARILDWTPAQTQAAIWTSAIQSDARRVKAPDLLILPEINA